VSESDIAAQQPLPKPRRGWVVPAAAGIVAGLVVGAGAVGLTWAFTGGDPAAGPTGDVATACSLVRRTGSMSKDSQVDFEQFGRWSAANALMLNVDKSDPGSKPLADSLRRSSLIVSQTFKAEGPEFEAEVRKAREFCVGR
jgi:hypothetical protein